MRVALVLTVLSFAAWSSVAAAQLPPAARAEARSRFDRGVTFFDEGDHERALAEFRRAYEIAPNARVLYNIGLVLTAAGRPAEASEALEQVLANPGEQDGRAGDHVRQPSGLQRSARGAVVKRARWLALCAPLGGCFVMPDPSAEQACVSCEDAGAGALDASAAQPPVAVGEVVGDATAPTTSCAGFDPEQAARPSGQASFLAVGVAERTLTSADGIHWATREAVAADAGSAELRGAARAAGAYVAATGAGIVRSTDAATWTAQQLPEVKNMYPTPMASMP